MEDLGMKLVLAAALMPMVLATDVMAGACADDGYNQQVTADQMTSPLNRLSGKRVLATAPSDGEEWNEDHCTTTVGSPGPLYKVGAGTKVDPRAYRGTWTPNNDDSVTYDYGGSAQYTWTVWRQPSSDALCWESLDGGSIIATAPEPLSFGALDCSTP
jgi:hypothetical protein